MGPDDAETLRVAGAVGLPRCVTVSRALSSRDVHQWRRHGRDAAGHLWRKSPGTHRTHCVFGHRRTVFDDVLSIVPQSKALGGGDRPKCIDRQTPVHFSPWTHAGRPKAVIPLDGIEVSIDPFYLQQSIDGRFYVLRRPNRMMATFHGRLDSRGTPVSSGTFDLLRETQSLLCAKPQLSDLCEQERSGDVTRKRWYCGDGCGIQGHGVAALSAARTRSMGTPSGVPTGWNLSAIGLAEALLAAAGMTVMTWKYRVKAAGWPQAGLSRPRSLGR